MTNPLTVPNAAAAFFATALLLAPALPAFAGSETEGTGEQAASQADTTEATQKVQDLVDNPVKDEDGMMQAESGGAKPVENWFGCKNSDAEQSENCEQVKDSEEIKDNGGNRSN